MKKLSRLLGTVLLFLTVSTIVNADPISMPDPLGGGPGNRFSFSLTGVIEDIASGPFEGYNGSQYTLSGFFFTNGTIDFTRLEIFLPDPDHGGGGGIIAMPEPEGGGGGSLVALPEPGGGGPGNIITLLPRIEFTFPGTIGSLPLARFLSLDLNGTSASPTVTTFSYQAAPVPEPSTILLFAAGLAGLTAIGRRRKVSPLRSRKLSHG